MYSMDDFSSHVGSMKFLHGEKFLDGLTFKGRFTDLLGFDPGSPDDGRFTGRENVLHKHLMWLAAQAIRHGFSVMNGNFPSEVVLGTLINYEPNAQAVKCPSGGRLVIVNEGLFSLLSSLSHVLTLSFPFRGKDETTGAHLFVTNPDQEEYVNDPKINTVFVKAVNDYADYAPRVESLQPYNHDDPRRLTFLDLFCTAVTFIVAHEYAHIILNHEHKEGFAQVRLREFSSGKKEAWRVSFLQLQEMEADCLALLMVANAFGRQCDIQSVFMGVSVVIAALKITEVINGRDHLSHPEANDRLNEMVGTVRQLLGSEVADSLSGVAVDILNITATLWGNNSAKLPEIKEEE